MPSAIDIEFVDDRFIDHGLLDGLHDKLSSIARGPAVLTPKPAEERRSSDLALVAVGPHS
jgi:hypothetical protein